MKAEVFNNESNVKEKQQFLDNEVENNREQQKKLGATDRAAAKLRLDYRDAETQRIQFQDEVCEWKMLDAFLKMLSDFWPQTLKNIFF